MSLITQYVQIRQQQVGQIQNNWSEPEDAAIGKSLSEAEAAARKKSTNNVNQKNRYENLAFLMDNTPSAAQCVNKIVESVLSDGIHIIPKGTKARKNKNQLRELELKTAQWNLGEIVESFMRQYLTYGDAYLYPVMSLDGSTVADLHVLKTSGISIRVDKQLLEESNLYKISMYEYTKGEQKRKNDGAVSYDADELIRYSRPGKDASVYGEAPLEAEQASIIFGIRVLNHNLRFFQNNAKPPLIIKLNEKTNREKALEFKRYIDENYRGPNKAWETMISYGGTEYQELDSPDQTQFMDMLTFVRIQACGLFGVPPFEVGVTDKSGLNNVETQHKDFIKTNINRKKIQITKILNDKLLPRMGITDWQFYLPPMDAVNEKQRIELNALAMSSGQMTVNEARKRNNLTQIEKPWAETLIIGDPKGVKGYADMQDVLTGKIIPDGSGSSDADPARASGREDLDGRDREPGSSPNSD